MFLSTPSLPGTSESPRLSPLCNSANCSRSEARHISQCSLPERWKKKGDMLYIVQLYQRGDSGPHLKAPSVPKHSEAATGEILKSMFPDKRPDLGWRHRLSACSYITFNAVSLCPLCFQSTRLYILCSHLSGPPLSRNTHSHMLSPLSHRLTQWPSAECENSPSHFFTRLFYIHIQIKKICIMHRAPPL